MLLGLSKSKRNGMRVIDAVYQNDKGIVHCEVVSNAYGNGTICEKPFIIPDKAWNEITTEAKRMERA